MSNKPMLSIHREGDTLVLRCPLELNPRLPKFYAAMLSAIGHPQMVSTMFAVLVQAIALCAPSLEDAEQMLDEAEACADQCAPNSTSVH